MVVYVTCSLCILNTTVEQWSSRCTHLSCWRSWVWFYPEVPHLSQWLKWAPVCPWAGKGKSVKHDADHVFLYSVISSGKLNIWVLKTRTCTLCLHLHRVCYETCGHLINLLYVLVAWYTAPSLSSTFLHMKSERAVIFVLRHIHRRSHLLFVSIIVQWLITPILCYLTFIIVPLKQASSVL